jgi:hypothetical protein
MRDLDTLKQEWHVGYTDLQEGVVFIAAVTKFRVQIIEKVSLDVNKL